MTNIALLLLLPVLASCGPTTGDDYVMETDVSRANAVCPADVSEADRGEYAACN